MLINDAKPDNNDNLEDIISLYDRKIDNTIKKYVNNNDNEDLKQEIYIKIWKNICNIKAGYNLWGWISTIASNHCKNYLRDNSKYKYIDNQSEEINLIENLPDEKKSDENTSKEIQSIILDKVEKLDKKFRDVIVLHDFEDYTYEQIAKKVGCPVGTVKSRLFKARTILREELSEFMDQDTK